MVGINRAHPLARGLLAIVLPAQGLAPRDIAWGRVTLSPQGGTTLKAAAGGMGWDVATTGTDGLQSTITAPGFPFSIGLVFVPGTLVANAHLAGLANSAALNTRSRIGLRIDPGGTKVGAYSMGTTGALGEDVSTNTVLAGRQNVAVGVLAATGSRKVYLNGIAGAGNATASIPASIDSLALGSAPGSSRQNGQVGQYQLLVVWDRVLSDAEAIEFTRNPWQLFTSDAQPARIAALAPQASAASVTGAGGIASAEAFGTAAVTWRKTIAPSGIASAEAFGTATVTRSSVAAVQPGGIASAEAFGTATVSFRTRISPSGIASAEAFGSATVSRNGAVIAAFKRHRMGIGIFLGL